MKLRNKKTGETMQGLELAVVEYGFGHEWMRDWNYNSIKAFLEDWEDVESAEPLIKDEKICKAVRAWAEANGVGAVIYKEDNYRFYSDDTEIGSMIEFEDMPEYIGLRHEHRYTIAELCGEEEE